MRLPKRSAFARPRAELTHLYSLFYPINVPDPAQADAYRRRGVELVHRIYLSRSSSPCPVAIECTASLIDALLLDSALSYHHTTSSSGSAIRSALSLALIRLVNSLADSLQQGVYAKSIASIAERQLGLPQSFVEFRHRATHEDLPSIAVCREAAGAALSWLQVNYWIPSLQALDAERQLQHNAGAATPSRPSTSKSGPSAAESRAAAVASLEPILDSYRRLAKAIARDQSLRSRNRASLEEIAGELEAWRRKTEAALPGRRWAGQAGEEEESEDDEEDDDGSDEEGGHWLAARRQNKAAAAASILTAADDLLLSSLLKPGIGIVPLAKSKRPRRDLALSEDIKQTWEYLFERRPELRGELAQRIVDVLAGSGADGQGQEDDDEQSAATLLKTDASYARTLQAWLLHLVPQDQKSETPVVDQLLQSLLANDSSVKPHEKKASPALPVLYSFLERRKKRGEDVAQLEELLELAERRQNERRGEKKGQDEPLLKGFEDMGDNGVAPPQQQEAGQAQAKETEDLDSLFARMERRQLASGGPPAPAAPPQQQKVQPVDEKMHVDEGGDEAREEEAAVADIPPQVTALPQGWTLYDEAEWKPTPIGCLAGRVPDFLRLEGPQQHAQHVSS